MSGLAFGFVSGFVYICLVSGCVSGSCLVSVGFVYGLRLVYRSYWGIHDWFVYDSYLVYIRCEYGFVPILIWDNLDYI